MKKVIVGACALVIIAGTIVFASSNTSAKEVKCNDTQKCCKVTPDCQPGDPNCVCPMMCTEKK